MHQGDTEEGATLAGFSLTDGGQTCRAVLPFREIGFVGMAQSLDFDASTGDLVLSGLNNAATAHM